MQNLGFCSHTYLASVALISLKLNVWCTYATWKHFFSKILILLSSKDRLMKISFKNYGYSCIVFQELKIHTCSRIFIYFYSDAAAQFLSLASIYTKDTSSPLPWSLGGMLGQVKLGILCCPLALVWSKAGTSFWCFWSPFVFFILKMGWGQYEAPDQLLENGGFYYKTSIIY